MSLSRKTHPDELYYVTLTVVGWIDVFSRRDYADEVIKNLKYCQTNKGLEIYCYCLMTNHLHMIAAAKTGILNYIFRDFKSFSAKRIFELIENNPQESRKEWLMYLFKYFGKPVRGQERQFWQHDNHPVVLYSPEVIKQKENYIHNNPVRAGIVSEPEHYYYCSAHPQSPLKVLEL